MNLFKKIKLFFVYRSIIKSIEKELEIEYNARVDRISRIYTVLNIPENLYDEPYNMRTSDIDIMSRNFIQEYRKNFSSFLIKRGLIELFDLYEIRKVDKYSYLLIFGYSLINTKKFANNSITTMIITFIISIFSIIIFTLIKTFI